MATITTSNPATGEELTSLGSASREQVDAAVASARGAYGAWSRMAPKERAQRMLRIADKVEQMADEFARLEMENCGKPIGTAKAVDVGNTVDVANANWTNTIGAPELIGVWKDPDFDPSKPAAYYARVLEIPTPRWTAYEAFRFGLDFPDSIPMITQERAYTSPIWYTPSAN